MCAEHRAEYILVITTDGNSGCVLSIEPSGWNLIQYSAVEHPFVLPNFANAFAWTAPIFASSCNAITIFIPTDRAITIYPPIGP